MWRERDTMLRTERRHPIDVVLERGLLHNQARQKNVARENIHPLLDVRSRMRSP
jgi:hypothetical protein